MNNLIKTEYGMLPTKYFIVSKIKIRPFVIFILFVLDFCFRASGQNTAFVNNTLENNFHAYKLTEKSYKYEIKYDKNNFNYKKIGEVVGSCGVFMMLGEGLVAGIYGGWGPNPINLPEKQTNILVGVGAGGLALFFLGVYLDHVGKKREANQKPKFSLIGTGNQVGIAYNFR